VGLHQESVTRSITQWGTEYSTVTDDASAVAAAKVVGYIADYYRPGPGYRGPADVEAALASRRAEAIARITDALEKHTGLDYGSDTLKWTRWAETSGRQPDGTDRAAPVGR